MSWSDPRERSRSLLAYLVQLRDTISAKGNLKPRKIKALLGALKPHHLGPFRDHATVQPKRFNELVPGQNGNCILVAKVICNLVSEDRFPFTLCAVDEDTVCFAVTIYNLAEGKCFAVGETIVIPEPFVQRVEVHYKDQEISYPSIRIDSPLTLLVNGKTMGADIQAPLQLHVEVKND